MGKPSTKRPMIKLTSAQLIPLSKTHPDWREGAQVVVGLDETGKRFVSSRVLKISKSGRTVETVEGVVRVAYWVE